MTTEEFAVAVEALRDGQLARDTAMAMAVWAGDDDAAKQLSREALAWLDGQDEIFARSFPDCLSTVPVPAVQGGHPLSAILEIQMELTFYRSILEDRAAGQFGYLATSPDLQPVLLTLIQHDPNWHTDAQEAISACPGVRPASTVEVPSSQRPPPPPP